MHEEKGERAGQFVRELFFDLQTIDGVKPLEIWNGFREPEDQGEKAALVKNLYKIALPLVNEHCAGKPFEAHAAKVYMTVAGILKEFSRHSGTALFESFPDPPTSSDEQKELYRVIKESAAGIVEQLDPPEGIAADRSPGLDAEVFPDGLFDFRELRIVDNELPFIIFTDKEYRVIHGLAMVYGWLIDLESLFLQTLAENSVDKELIEEYRQFSALVHRDNPLLMEGRKMGSPELTDYIRVKLQYQDYLDVFEKVYRWFEMARDKYLGR